ncbi:hypothetical protein ASZ90_014321 [hydrocarbon metagenome]|uniref:Uncharacterized protein n=1 Tax=hydrocarbon metagenome TaxID=938273 RepID=A0A0W8F505_9ZZZZ
MISRIPVISVRIGRLRQIGRSRLFFSGAAIRPSIAIVLNDKPIHVADNNQSK